LHLGVPAQQIDRVLKIQKPGEQRWRPDRGTLHRLRASFPQVASYALARRQRRFPSLAHLEFAAVILLYSSIRIKYPFALKIDSVMYLAFGFEFLAVILARAVAILTHSMAA